MSVDNKKLAKELIDIIGGKDNVSNVVHCATRLRFTLKNNKKADAVKAKAITGVVTVIEQGGQFQVVIGNTVPEVYKEVVNEIGVIEQNDSKDDGPKGSLLNRLIDVIAGIFPPILGAMCGGGLIKGIVAICSAMGVLTPEMGTYIVLSAIGDSVFYFLPILLGFSAGRKFGGNEYITAIVGAALIYPDLVELAGGLGGGQITFLGIPMVLMNYASSVIPIVVAAYVCCKIEKFARSKLPSAIKNFFAPMICLLVTVPLTLFIIGPSCLFLSDILAKGYMALPGVMGGIIVGAFWQVLVIFGMHWGFIPVMINNITTVGVDSLSSYAQVAAMSQTGSAFGMSLKMKNKGVRGTTISTVISGIFGITEPIVYGVTLPRKRPFVLGMIGGACGGAITGIFGGVHYAMGAFGVLCLPTTIDPVTGIGAAFWGTLMGLIVAFVVAAALNYIFFTDDTVPDDKGSKNNNGITRKDKILDTKLIYSPMRGIALPLSKSKDPVHTQETLGKGVLIIPNEGKVYAPFDGTAAMVYDTKHALGLVSDEGVELLIHVGIDTVKLGGKYFRTHVKQGQNITKGQLLLEFDIRKIKDEGYETETPVIITNTSEYFSIMKISSDLVNKGEKMIEIM